MFSPAKIIGVSPFCSFMTKGIAYFRSWKKELHMFGWSIRQQILKKSQSHIYGSVSKPCTPVVHIKIAGKWMFIPLKMVLIGIDPYPYFNFATFLLPSHLLASHQGPDSWLLSSLNTGGGSAPVPFERLRLGLLQRLGKCSVPYLGSSPIFWGFWWWFNGDLMVI